ncbi:MAG: VapC toxin family PIN domain ribonuclease [Nocardioides sp.]|nr:VapC toxin family PIN domain ribonuclease [Nocardioides sp.]
MTVVVDASMVVSALVDDGPDGRWSVETMRGASDLLAPHHLPAEVTGVLRRLVAASALSAHQAALALADLSALPLRLVPFAPWQARVWQLRGAVATYDAWYVAVAEAHDAPLATLDRRLARAPGPRCRWVLPPGDG